MATAYRARAILANQADIIADNATSQQGAQDWINARAAQVAGSTNGTIIVGERTVPVTAVLGYAIDTLEV